MTDSERSVNFRDFHRTVDDLFSQFSRDYFGEPFIPTRPLVTGPGASSGDTNLSVWGSHRNAMRMDVVERDDHYAVHVDLPGVPKDEVKISWEGDVLTIGAERTEQRKEEQQNFYLQERRFGKMSRSLKLPTDVDMNHTQAKFDNGELSIWIPRTQKKADQIRAIEIQ